MLRQRAVLRLIAAMGLSMALAAVMAPPRADRALACTSGVGNFEHYAVGSDLIIIVDAIAVGDAVNRAPTVSASPTPSATPTFEPTITPAASPPAPQPPMLTPGPVEFHLTGIGAAFRVQRTIVGASAEIIEHQWDHRANIEAEIRELEAGVGGISSCPLGAFTVRYEQGRHYLLFFNDYQGMPYQLASFPIDGDQLVLDDPLHLRANNGVIYMEPATYARYFAGTRTSETGSGFIDQPRVPLSMVLRAVAGLRGDPSVAPPDAGSAGLKDAG